MAYDINKDIHISIFCVTFYKSFYQTPKILMSFYNLVLNYLHKLLRLVGVVINYMQSHTGLISGKMFLGWEDAEKHLYWDFSMVSFNNGQINEVLLKNDAGINIHTLMCEC
jgi:hypothetical protein